MYKGNENRNILSKLKNFVKYNKTIYSIYYLSFNSILNCLNKIIKKEKIILFVCYGGRKYDDSPKIFYEFLKEKGLMTDYKMVWAFDNVDSFKYLNLPYTIEINSVKYFITAMKSKYWITNSSIQRGLNFKSKKNIYVNFQHGTLGIKRIGNSISQKNTSFKIKITEQFDYFIIQGKHEKKWLSKALDLKEENIHLLGLPRNLELYHVDEKMKENAKKKLGLPLNKKTILYAPTFRENSLEKANINYTLPFDLEFLKSRLQDRYNIVLTNHYEVNDGLQFDNDENHFVFNFFNFKEINQLLLAADILITDYSSIAFDGFIAEIPVLSFAYDYEEYFGQRGDSYIDLNSLFSHGAIKKQNDLIEIINNMDFEKEKEFSRKQKEKYIYCNDNVLMDCYRTIFDPRGKL